MWKMLPGHVSAFSFPVVQEKIEPLNLALERATHRLRLRLYPCELKDESIFVCSKPALKPQLCAHSLRVSGRLARGFADISGK